MGGPFLVPVKKGAISHFEGMHKLCGQEGLINRDKVGFKYNSKVCPGAKVGRSKGKGILLFVFGPFISRAAGVPSLK